MPRCGGIGTGFFIRKHAGRWERNPQMISCCARFVACRKSFRRTQQKVSHTMPIKLLTAYMIGLPAAKIRALKLANCSYTELDVVDADHAHLWVWNDTSHLHGACLQKGEAL